MTTVGIVVPAFRPDPETLQSYVAALHDSVDALSEVRIELDDPRPEVEESLADVDATVSTVPYRRGKGAAITHGFERLDTDVLAFADADGATPAESVASVVAAVRDEDADLAVGSRRHPEADVRSHQTFARRRMGDAFALAARSLLDAKLYDYQCGAKAIDASAWRAVRQHLYEPGFAWDIELVSMTAALELQIAEVPVTWIDKPNSTVSPIRTSWELGKALLMARHRAKRVVGSRLHSALADDETALVNRSRFDPTDD